MRYRLIVALAVPVVTAVAVGGLYLFGQPGGEAVDDPAHLALGRQLYGRHCASCHGVELEGQPNWQERRADGKLPAPPHDASGHTWHHPDQQLFAITKHGLAPFAGPDYKTDMPAFGNVLSDDEIWAVLDYIKSRWPEEVRARQAESTRRAEGS